MFSIKIETVNLRPRATFVTDEMEKIHKLNQIHADHFTPQTAVNFTPVQKAPLQLTLEDIENIMTWTRERDKIQIIKMVREVTGLGLKESKEIVDKIIPYSGM